MGSAPRHCRGLTTLFKNCTIDVVMESFTAQKPLYPRWLLVAVLGGICILAYTLIVIYGFSFFKGSTEPFADTMKFLSSDATSVSGHIDLNGTPPSGATITIVGKQNGQSEFTTLVSDIGAVDGAVWSWNNAISKTEYILQANLVQNGKVIASSQQLVLIAPADSEILRINVPQNSSTPTPNQIQAAISGTFNINGYIPAGSTITIASRQVGTNQFATVLSGLSTQDNSIWSWTKASENTQYEIQASLMNNGTILSQSQVLTVAAPATNETLTINSTAPAPTPVTVGISGSISLNGYVPPSGSYITLGVRVTGTSQFTQQAGNISATDGITWNYANAQSGTSYDIQAYLWQNNQPYSQSQILTVSAPATSEVLTINAATPPSTQPSGNSISVNCNSYSSSANLWQVTVNYNNTSSLQNAIQYSLYIGTNQGGNQQVNLTTTPSNPNQTQTYITGYLFTQGTTYYAQYAYATCASCNAFSQYSPALTFTCNQPASPTPTNTPVPTPTNTPIPTPTNTPVPPTNTPIPTPTNTPIPTPIP